MTTLVAGAVVVVLSAIAALHVYWAAGGAWGKDAVIPTVGGVRTLKPGRTATLAVAASLVLAAACVAMRAQLVAAPLLRPRLLGVASWTIAFVFAARVVGDRRTFGLFKRVHGTRFARLDTLLYTPLSGVLSLGCVVVSLGQ